MPHLKLRDDAELYYETHGSGPPLFLVPGLGGDGRFWGDNVAALAQEFTVVVHDHRGTARSTLSKIAYSVEQMADDALQLIDGLGYKRVHWCGHSTGDAMVTPLYFTEELVRLIPDARAYVLPDGGHFYPNVHAEEFRRVVTSFLLAS